jgi:sulfopyruvate decarboxylase TPP-binding subunit
MPHALARSVEASLLLEELRAIGTTHVLTVPDTHQRTLLDLLARAGQPRLLNVCGESEAIAVSGGLFLGGQRPVVLIQNNGLYTCINALKAIAIDARIPTLLLIGQLGRDVTREPSESRWSFTRMVEPTLETWKVPFFRLEGPDDLGCLRQAFQVSREQRGPAAVLVGAPTS